eukprot:TRINITY_DN17694_c0_g1_i1.p1 TRINITY_DN17694_c0_g1~~TRINITY_DN17694_c0_g1_i1.p1  ORF type:complete len:444 (-),score=81.42 TRINITY_DN17694_c0_g1_i1:66-1364(-)
MLFCVPLCDDAVRVQRVQLESDRLDDDVKEPYVRKVACNSRCVAAIGYPGGHVMTWTPATGARGKRNTLGQISCNDKPKTLYGLPDNKVADVVLSDETLVVVIAQYRRNSQAGRAPDLERTPHQIWVAGNVYIHCETTKLELVTKLPLQGDDPVGPFPCSASGGTLAVVFNGGTHMLLVEDESHCWGMVVRNSQSDRHWFDGKIVKKLAIHNYNYMFLYKDGTVDWKSGIHNGHLENIADVCIAGETLLALTTTGDILTAVGRLSCRLSSLSETPHLVQFAPVSRPWDNKPYLFFYSCHTKVVAATANRLLYWAEDDTQPTCVGGEAAVLPQMVIRQLACTEWHCFLVVKPPELKLSGGKSWSPSTHKHFSAEFKSLVLAVLVGTTPHKNRVGPRGVKTQHDHARAAALQSGLYLLNQFLLYHLLSVMSTLY